MSRNNFLYSIVTMVIVAIIFYSFMGNGNQENYLEDVLNKRKETDSFMRNSDESPFKNAELAIDHPRNPGVMSAPSWAWVTLIAPS